MNLGAQDAVVRVTADDVFVVCTRRDQFFVRVETDVTVFVDVDATGKTATGEEFADIREFKAILLKDEDQIARGITEKLLTYGLGRSLGFPDRETVEHIVSQIKNQKYGFRTLIHEITQSETFRKP